MQYLFANYVTPEEAGAQEIQRVEKRNAPPGLINPRKPKRRVWWDILVEQMINAAIVGGVAAAATGFADWQVAVKAFGITALLELRKYRKL